MIEVFKKSEADLFEEIAERGRNDLIHDKEGYDMLVEEVIEEHQDLDEIDIDSDNEAIETKLKDRYQEYTQRLLVE